ncbi:MAG: outer membrane beta-barrel protein [bacterium]|nr:outer membrane beta-barrel protein [bacterium]
MRILLVLCVLWTFDSSAQQTNFTSTSPNSLKVKGNRGGILSLGMRSTLSTFNGHHNESNGFGVGGQFRLQFSDRVNSDWFFDYIQSDVGDFATRTDYHIGWSVLYYPLKNTQPLVQPYILAGHCFDRTFMVENGNRSNSITRWSSAAQAGLGVHFNITERFDISVVSQYMLHLGNEIGAHEHDGHVEFHEVSGSSMEGHLLFHVGLNYKIADLW